MTAGWENVQPAVGGDGTWRARIQTSDGDHGKVCHHAHAHADTAQACGRRWARVLNAAEADTQMLDFYVTFGNQYPRTRHPVWEYAHHDGWVRVVAPTVGVARQVAGIRLGVYWSGLYDADDFAGDEHFYPLGELAVATYVRDTNGDHTWDQSRAVELADARARLCALVQEPR